jgi:endonuclease G, mitochondrial
MTLPFNFYFSTLIMLSYWITLSQQEILMKTFNQVFAILITVALFFGCPPKHEEPVNGSLVPTSRSEHLVMGNPSSAVDSVTYSNNYLMEKQQYVVSYNRDRGIPNWVVWHLDNTWLGEVPRKDTFRPDSTLPEDWYHVKKSSYNRSGYARGHHCPSADRTNTVEDNSATFLMTNMMPQAANNNSGPWEKLEKYCRTLVSKGKELYIYAGGYGSQGTVDNGHVTIPSHTWKVIMVLAIGENDLKRVTTSTRLIGVDMPNNDDQISRTDDWKSYRICVDSIEARTGFDFFSNVPKSIQSVIESAVDSL